VAGKNSLGVSDKMTNSRYNNEDNQEVVQYVNGKDAGEDVRASDEKLMNAKIKPLEDGLADCRRQLGNIQTDVSDIKQSIATLNANTENHEKHNQERRSRSFRISMLLLSALIAALFGLLGFIGNDLL